MKSFKKILDNKKLNCIHASIHGKGEDIVMENEYQDKSKENFALSNKLTNHYKFDTVSKHGAVYAYTRNSEPYNSHLWAEHHKKDNPSWSQFNMLEGKKTIKHLDSVLKSHSSPEDMHVYSSTIHDPRALKNDQGIVHHPAYLSTSIYKPVAMNRDINSREDMKTGDFHHHVLDIHVPKGSPGAYVNHVSKYPGEYEHILPRGSNLKYHSTETIAKKFNNYRTEKTAHNYTHIHKMELIND
jgi:hypothetical protein